MNAPVASPEPRRLSELTEAELEAWAGKLFYMLVERVGFKDALLTVERVSRNYAKRHRPTGWIA